MVIGHFVNVPEMLNYCFHSLLILHNLSFQTEETSEAFRQLRAIPLYPTSEGVQNLNARVKRPLLMKMQTEQTLHVNQIFTLKCQHSSKISTENWGDLGPILIILRSKPQ